MDYWSDVSGQATNHVKLVTLVILVTLVFTSLFFEYC